MDDLFGIEVNTTNYHLKEIYTSGELDEAVTIRKIRIVQNEGGAFLPPGNFRSYPEKPDNCGPILPTMGMIDSKHVSALYDL